MTDDLIWLTHTVTIPAALGLLPGKMDSPQSRALLLAIGLQESQFQHRLQIAGPARGFWQFEKGGVQGVVAHPISSRYLPAVCELLEYDCITARVYEAIAHNDLLAAVLARLLLWTDPKPIPVNDASAAWAMYLRCWRPGKPHPKTWAAHYQRAWEMVDATA